jgi:hypothetical protein
MSEFSEIQSLSIVVDEIVGSYKLVKKLGEGPVPPTSSHRLRERHQTVLRSALFAAHGRVT